MPDGAVVIRPAVTADIPRLQQIEIVAGRQFIDVGLARVAEDEPFDDDELTAFIESGAAWVAVVGDVVAGYAVASVVDGEGHLDQVSVDPAFGGRGVGRVLLEEVVAWTLHQGLHAITLTTFRDVPWNGPYYARLGFVPLDDQSLTAGLASIRATERDRGLDALHPRMAMRHEFGASRQIP